MTLQHKHPCFNMDWFAWHYFYRIVIEICLLEFNYKFKIKNLNVTSLVSTSILKSCIQALLNHLCENTTSFNFLLIAFEKKKICTFIGRNQYLFIQETWILSSSRFPKDFLYWFARYYWFERSNPAVNILSVFGNLTNINVTDLTAIESINRWGCAACLLFSNLVQWRQKKMNC